MALFKIYRGLKSELPKTMHEGFAYFVEDTGALFIDVSNTQRVQVNALNADGLKLENGDVINADEVLTTSDIVNVENGGTGAGTLQVNALLLGNGTDPIKMIVIPKDYFVLGSDTEGVVGKSKEEILNLLSVYTKTETNSKVDEVTSVAYTDGVLKADGWKADYNLFSQSYIQTRLKCGKNGAVPPIVSYLSNKADWSKIIFAEATPGEGIKFYCQDVPVADIKIVVLDVK